MEEVSGQPDFWQDAAQAQAVMRQLTAQRNLVKSWRDLEKRVTDLIALIDLATEEEDHSLIEEINREIGEIAARQEELEFKLTLGGDYDSRNALLAIHAGAGGTDSQDWAEMLLRMYLRWAERRQYAMEVLDTSLGEEAGIKSAVVEIRGEYAYGYLKSEHGVHRLVRLSPFDYDHARHTSFALVEVLPEAEEDVDIKIASEDLKIETFGSSGPGGQHMQKTASAVRITHLPTGLVVSCQSQRSQLRNKETALRVLRARLLELELDKQAKEKAQFKGKYVEAGWGNQIRSYILHPYRLVKDHRTDYETSDTEAVMDGELDEFINAYLRFKIGESQGGKD